MESLGRILYVIPGDVGGSDQIFAKRQANVLRNFGISVDIFHLRVWSSICPFLKEVRRLRSVIQKTKPNIIHAQFGTMTSAACAFCNTKKLIITYRGSDLNPSNDVSRVRMHLSHFLSQVSSLRAARIICVSKQLEERLWWAPNHVEILPSAVDLDLFRPMEKAEARFALGWKQDEKVVLFNEGYDPISKGIHIVKQAIKIAEKSIGRVRFMSLRKNVSPDDMPLYYNASDCLIVASAYEGSPNVVKEALACNCPVVSSKAGDAEERLRGVYPSRIVGRNTQELGKALAEVLELGKRSNGRENVTELSLEHITRRLIQVYNEVLEKEIVQGRS